MNNNAVTKLADEVRQHREKYEDLNRQCNEYAEKLGDDFDTMTAGQRNRWEDLYRAKEKHRELAEHARDRWTEEMARYVSANPDMVVRGDDSAADAPERTMQRAHGEYRSTALRSIDRDRYANDDTRELATRLVESDPTGDAARWAAVAADPNYLRCYTSLLIDPARGHLGWSAAERSAFEAAQAWVRSESRGVTSGGTTAGGYMVPFALDPSIIVTNDGTLNSIREAARVVTTTSSAWHGITSAGVTMEWKTEAAEAADATPTVAQPAIPVHFADAFVPYSIEAEQDIGNLVNELRRVMLDAKQIHEATAFTTGSGTGRPKGIITAVAADSGSIVAPTTAETFAVADLYKVATALAARHQSGASWMTNPTLEYTIRGFATGDGANSAFWADLGAGTPPVLLGKPYRGCSDMDGVYSAAATAAHNYLLLFGDFGKYQIVDRVGVTTEIVPHLVGANQRPTGQRGLFMYWRVGADCLDTDAFRLLDIPTTA